MSDLATIRANLLAAIADRAADGGVTEFREGPDSATFSSIDEMLKALERLSDPEVVAAATGVTASFATFSPVP